MKKTTVLASLAFLFVLASCSKEDEPAPTPAAGGSLEFQFQAQYGGEPLVLYEALDHPGGAQLLFSDLSFYISDLSLIRQDGSEFLLQEIDRIRLSDAHLDPATAPAGTPYQIDGIPAGNYTGVRFGIGVKDSLNALNPGDFPNDHPLYQSGQYWTGWQSYIFIRTEGKADTAGTGIFDLDLALHTGGDTTYRAKTFMRPVSISDGEKTVFPILIDYRDMLVPAEGEPYDFIATPQIHSLSHVNEAIELANNFQQALK